MTCKRHGQRPESRKRRPKPRQRKKKRPTLKQRERQKMTSHKARIKKLYRTKLKNRNKLNNIVNLSSHKLTKAEISILSKGLGFILKPKNIDKNNITEGVAKFRQQIFNKYKTYIKSRKHTHSELSPTPSQTTLSQGTNTQSSMGPAKLTFNPFLTLKKFKRKYNNTNNPDTDNSLLDSVLNRIQTELEQMAGAATQTKGDNITRAERVAIKSLRNNKNIVINKADKGSTIVVVAKKDYIEDGLKHLDDPTVYRKLKTDMIPRVYSKITSFLNTLRWQSWMSYQLIDFCTPPTDYRTSQLYFLKKIHKNPMGISLKRQQRH